MKLKCYLPNPMALSLSQGIAQFITLMDFFFCLEALLKSRTGLCANDMYLRKMQLFFKKSDTAVSTLDSCGAETCEFPVI